MAHEVDKFGYPLNPELRRLEGNLCNLAAEWRSVARGIDQQDNIVQEYHQTFEAMYKLGWDGVLDIECELPTHLRPEVYYAVRDKQS